MPQQPAGRGAYPVAPFDPNHRGGMAPPAAAAAAGGAYPPGRHAGLPGAVPRGAVPVSAGQCSRFSTYSRLWESFDQPLSI